MGTSKHDPAEATDFLDSEATFRAAPPNRRPPIPPALAPGEVIAKRFKILRFLGQGGMGQVFAADDLELGDRLAVKVIRPGIAGDERVIVRFKREVQLARQVTHPNVCRIFDLYQHRPDGAAGREAWPLLFLTMELLRGETLARYLRRAGPLPLAEALPLARQMVAALDAAHQAGVVHRDFKTANVMLVAGGGDDRRAVVTDFGLAHALEPADDGPEPAPRPARRFHGGTPAYMSPEQHAGQPASAASDLYAFGLVLYEMLTGRRPFAGSAARLARLHREAAPTPPSSLMEDFDPAVEQVILHCLEKDPRRRPASASAVAALLGPDAALGWRPAPGLAIPHRPHWRIDKKLGEGGFGEVWLAAHHKTGEQRVFKFCYDGARLRTLQREITLFRLLKEELGDRDDIARIFDWEFERPPYFIEAEYTAGGSLAQWAEEQGGIAAVPLAARLEIVAQVATALAAAHSVGVLHKDVKPANVLITRDAAGGTRAQLTDFGVGAVTERQRLAAAGITVVGLTEKADEPATSHGGTRLYMAPELLEGKAATLQADVYALGVLLYQVVVGDLSRALAPGWQREVADELLAEDIAEAVDGSPRRRLGDASRLAERLRSLERRRAARQAERRLREEAEKSRRRRRLGAAVIGVSLLFAAAMFFQQRRTAREAQRAEREALKARNIARVAVAGEWMTRDPTKAALALLEVEQPAATAFAVAKMRQALSQELALLELRDHDDVVWTASFNPRGDRVVTASADGTARVWDVGQPGDLAAGLAVVLEGHGGGLWAASFSPDGRRVVTASRDGTARVWASDGAARPIVLEGHRGMVRAAAFGPAGDRVVTGSTDGTARLWDLAGRAPSDVVRDPVVLAGHGGTVMAVAFDPHGGRVVTASENDYTVRIWDAAAPAGDPIVLRGGGSTFWSACLSPRGDRVAATANDGKAWVWDLGEAPARPTILEGHGDVAVAAAFDSRGERLVTASWDGTARVWDLGSAGDPVVLEGHGGGLWTASFSPRGDRVVTASRDGTARVWNVAEPAAAGGVPLVLKAQDGWIVAASFDPRGDRVVTASRNGIVRLWDVSGPREPVVLAGHGRELRTASFSPRGDRVVTASEDGTARVWPARVRPTDGSGAPVVLAGHDGGVVTAAFDPEGERVVTGSWDGTVRVWPADGSGSPIVFAGHDAVVWKVAFSPRGDRVVSGSLDGTARVWPLETPAAGSAAPIVLEGHQDEVSSASFGPRGDRVLTTSRDGTARVWRADGSGPPVVFDKPGSQPWMASFSPDGDRVVVAYWETMAHVWASDGSVGPIVLAGHTLPVLDASFSPQGDRVVTASVDGTARIWTVDADSPGDSAIVLRGHSDWVVDASFSPDGDRVVTASSDGTARVWSAHGGEPIILEGHDGAVATASFSPDGSRVVTASADGTARVWRLLDVPELIAALRARTRVCLAAEFREKNLGEPAAEARRHYEECERSHGRLPEPTD